MSLASKGTRAAARTLQVKQIAQPTKRHASHGSYVPSDEKALHLPHANPSGSEGMGVGFLGFLAAIPVFYIGYSLAKGDPNNTFNKLYLQYKEGSKDNERREILHQTALKQAIHDRSSLFSQPRDTSGPELRMPEILNTGSPYNVAAGHGAADLRTLEEFYAKKYAAAEEERLAKYKDGKITTVYD